MLHLFIDTDRLSDFEFVSLLIADPILTTLVGVFCFAWAVRPRSSVEGL